MSPEVITGLECFPYHSTVKSLFPLNERFHGRTIEYYIAVYSGKTHTHTCTQTDAKGAATRRQFCTIPKKAYSGTDAPIMDW